MYALQRHSFLVAVLIGLSYVLSVSARRTHALAKALGRWLNHRREARLALSQLSAMTERELRDVGLSRSDIHRVAWESPRDRERCSSD